MMSHQLTSVCLVAGLLLGTQSVDAQRVQTSTPQQRFGSGYFEQSGFQWSIRGPNFFGNSGAGAVAPFGNPDPGAGLRGGLGFGGGGVSGSLGFHFSQGNSRTMTSTTPSITTLDGYPGTITSGTIRPFVTGVTPVVGGYSYGQPIRDNFSSQMFQSHQQAQAMQLRSSARASLNAKQAKAAEAFDRAVRAESEGNLQMARANYRKALALDQGPLRQEILLKMHSRGWK